jgi:CMP-N-acetylneuraminic acid synthetase
MTFRPIALIPARAGSERAPFKNIATICGRSLVQRAVDVACDVEEFAEVWVSSDCASILDSVAGCDPRLRIHTRPSKMARADSPIEPLLQLIMQRSPKASHIALLNPTSPFRTAETLRKCLDIAAMRPEIGTIATVCERNFHRYVWLYDEEHDRNVVPWRNEPRPRSQELDGLDVEHGVCYLVSRRVVERGLLFDKNLKNTKVQTDQIEAWDIDYRWQIAAARGIMAERLGLDVEEMIRWWVERRGEL